MRWSFYYGLLESFAEREKHTIVPQGHQENGHRLYAWVQTQRKLNKEGKLSKKQTAELEGLLGGGVWDWSLEEYAEKWRQAEIDSGRHQLAVLEAFTARYGHAKIPVFAVDYWYYPIGEWWAGIRKAVNENTLKDETKDAIDQAILAGKRLYAERMKKANEQLGVEAGAQ